MSTSFTELADSVKRIVGAVGRVDVNPHAARIDIEPYVDGAAHVSIYDEGHGFHVVAPGLDVDTTREFDEVARVVGAIAEWGISTYDWFPLGTFTVSEPPSRERRRRRRILRRYVPWSDSGSRDDIEPVSTLTWGRRFEPADDFR